MGCSNFRAFQKMGCNNLPPKLPRDIVGGGIARRDLVGGDVATRDVARRDVA
jgi:hypothetical protein